LPVTGSIRAIRLSLASVTATTSAGVCGVGLAAACFGVGDTDGETPAARAGRGLPVLAGLGLSGFAGAALTAVSVARLSAPATPEPTAVSSAELSNLAGPESTPEPTAVSSAELSNLAGLESTRVFGAELSGASELTWMSGAEVSAAAGVGLSVRGVVLFAGGACGSGEPISDAHPPWARISPVTTMTIVAATRLHFIGKAEIDHGPVCPATAWRARPGASTVPVRRASRRAAWRLLGRARTAPLRWPRSRGNQCRPGMVRRWRKNTAIT
jgi:hypothetical protein